MHVHTKSLSIAFLTALLGLSIACSKATPSDDTITKDVDMKVAADPDTKDSQVNVVVKERKVTLTGKVKTPAVQQKVEQIAKEEPGVTGVDDQIVVEAEQAARPMVPPPPPPQPIVASAGTLLTVRVGQALSSKTSQTGQSFLATLAQPVSVGGRTAILEDQRSVAQW